MKTIVNRFSLLALMFLLALPATTFSQDGLLGSWKYVAPGGEMTMQINASTIVINNQSFPIQGTGQCPYD